MKRIYLFLIASFLSTMALAQGDETHVTFSMNFSNAIKGQQSIDFADYINTHEFYEETEYPHCATATDWIEDLNYSISNISWDGSLSPLFGLEGAVLQIDHDEISSNTVTKTFHFTISYSYTILNRWWEMMEVDNDIRCTLMEIPDPESGSETISVDITFDFSAERAITAADVIAPDQYCDPEGGSLTLQINPNAYENTSAYRIYSKSSGSETPLIFNTESFTISESQLSTYYNSGTNKYEFYMTEQEEFRMEQPDRELVAVSVLNPETPVITGSLEFCENDLTQVYTVTNSTGTLSTTGTTGGVATINGNNITVVWDKNSPTHTLVVRNTIDGCYREYSNSNIRINPLPSVDLAAIPDVCVDGEKLSLAGFADSGGDWSGTGVNASDEFDPVVAGPGTHTLTYSYTDGNSCTVTNTTTVTVNDLPAPPTATDDEVCDAGEVTLSVNNPVSGYSYRWYVSDNGGTSEHTGTSYSPSISSTTTYYVEAVNSSGCVSS
ncbi:immunoglobulin domain-containing protein, partial [Xanthovirga aplysinae]|uniref:immunoglobulin domain-containing protein n=1 Tax=Xanthovirga aplysinae TaxID=2529853 RepID=UPI0012BC0C9E